MEQYKQYLDKPVPVKAEDLQQSYADLKIFALELLRFLVDYEGIVRFVYEFKPPSEEMEE